MVEYTTKEEVIQVLTGFQHEALIEKKTDTAFVIGEAIKQIRSLYSIRPPQPARWRTIGDRREAIYCGGCGFKTLGYKRTKYCPNCGRPMLNGVGARDDQR